MRRVFIVIGEKGSRKSSTIRALTGAFRRDKLQVATQDGNMDIVVQIMSLPEKRISPEEFVQTINATENRPDVLVALKLRAYRGYPDAFEYIERFRQEDWDIAAIVLLGPAPQGSSNRLRGISHGFLAIPNSEELPANGIAHQIREGWGWQ